jgi:hypothetical protein
MKDDIGRQSPGRRAAAYWFVDGLPEIVFGLVYLAMGAAGIALGFQPKDWLLRAMALVSGVAFLLLFLRGREILDLLKARFTYPRTGYVRPPLEVSASHYDSWLSPIHSKPVDENATRFRTRTVFLFFVAMQVMDFVGNLLNHGRVNRWMLPLVMGAVAALEYFWNRDEARPYAWWSAAAIAAGGAVSLVWELPRKSLVYMPLLIGGVWLLAHGVWSLVIYLRNNPRIRVLEGVRQ